MSKQYKEIVIEHGNDKPVATTIVRSFKKEDFKGEAWLQVKIFEKVRYVNVAEEDLKYALELFS